MAGAQVVRLAVLDELDAMSIEKIKAQVQVPIVADIHFDYKLAILAVQSGADKIRINPGNIGSVATLRLSSLSVKKKGFLFELVLILVLYHTTYMRHTVLHLLHLKCV